MSNQPTLEKAIEEVGNWRPASKDLLGNPIPFDSIHKCYQVAGEFIGLKLLHATLRLEAEKQLAEAAKRVEALEAEQVAIRTGFQKEFDAKIADDEDILDLVEKFIEHHKQKETKISSLEAKIAEKDEALKQGLKVVSEITDIDSESRAGWAHKAMDAALSSSTTPSNYISKEKVSERLLIRAMYVLEHAGLEPDKQPKDHWQVCKNIAAELKTFLTKQEGLIG
jgi:hypothetical protein